VNIEQREVLTIVEGEIPAAETLDLSEKKGATAGRAVWNTYFKAGRQSRSTNMLPVLVEQIRKRSGLRVEPPKASEFIDNE
jgi:elongation factor 2